MVPPNDVGFVRIRAESNVDAAEIGTIPVGKTMSYDSEEYGWYHVSFEGMTGWVSGLFVTKVE
jgi:uncharacterized protein YraI